jgi:hypothetical protein
LVLPDAAAEQRPRGRSLSSIEFTAAQAFGIDFLDRRPTAQSKPSHSPTSKRILPALAVYAASSQAATVLEGKTAFSDYTQQKPGVMHKITPADLPAPYPTQSVDNGPKLVPARKARCRKR